MATVLWILFFFLFISILTMIADRIADFVIWCKTSPAVREWAASCRWNLETAEILGRKFFARMFSYAKSAVYRDYDWRVAHGK